MEMGRRGYTSTPLSRIVSWLLAVGLLVLMVLYGPGILILKPHIARVQASALSFICASSAATTSTGSCSGEQTGDLLLVAAFDASGNTVPSLASGFTSINSVSTGGNPSNRIALNTGWNTASGSTAGSGTWTSATDVIMQVYRGQATSPIGNNATSNGNASSVTYAADSLTASDGSSWFAGFADRRTADSHLATPPSGTIVSMTNRASVPATPAAAGHDTNGPTASSWGSANVTGFSGSAEYASIVIEILASPTITVGSSGTLVSNLAIPSTGNYTGGAFTFSRDVGTDDVTSIKVTENGTVNAAANLANLTLWYYQTSSCGTTIPGGASQFNSTAGTFSGTGPYTSTVTGSMTVTSGAPMCVYAQLDVGSGAAPGDTIQLEIANPSTDVVVSSGTVSPSSAVAITGTITLVPPGPTTDQILRGGEWFSGGVKQSFYWAQ